MIQQPAESLDNIGVLVTRPAHQAKPFINMLETLGATAIPFPVIEIAPPDHPEGVVEQLKQLNDYQLIIFISANAVEYGLKFVEQAGKSIDCPIAAIGKRTAEKLQQHGQAVSIQSSSGYNTEALLQHPQLQETAIAGNKVLIFRGTAGRELLADSLRSRGAQVDYAEVYQRKQPEADSHKLETEWTSNSLQIVTVTSNEALKNLYHMLDKTMRDWLLNTPLVVPSQRCAELAHELGFKQQIVQAANATDEAMLEAIQHWSKNRG